MTEKPRKQIVYGLWLIESTGYSRWLEWTDVRLGDEPWMPQLALRPNREIFIFSSHRDELVELLKYMKGVGLPEDVQRLAEETATAEYVYPINTESIKIRKCALPAPSESS